MKTKLIIRTAGVTPADDHNRCRCVRENAAESNHLTIHVGGHNRITATVFLVAVLCLCLLPPTIAAPGSWIRKADMPMGVGATAGCAVEGVFYVIGGHERTNFAQLKTVFAYDPKTDTWSRKADMPTARRWLAVAALDGIIYAIGGGGWYEKEMNTVEAYDPKANAWVVKAKMPTARSFLAAAVVDGILYAIGGGNQSQTPYSTVEAYDPKTDQWTTKSKLPRPLMLLTASVADGLIYAFEGTATFVYDPKTDRWTAESTFSPPNWGLASGVVDGTIYLFGGVTPSWWTSYDLVMAYDPVQDKFTARRKMPRKRLCAASAVIDGKVYIAGGASEEPVFVNPKAVFYNILDVFDPQGGVTPQILSATLTSSNRLGLTWQAESGRKYAVESSPKIDTNRWTRVSLPTGATILAANELVETSCPAPLGESCQFYRVLEAD
jgi:hypothetical protein